MEADLKRINNQKNLEENRSLDRLSCLPDSLLAHILSFLDTKTVIRTSVLSKRYEFLWTLLQSLDFKLRITSLNCFDHECGHDDYVLRIGNSNAISFKSYVNRILELREHSDLNTFRLSLHNCASKRFVQNCVDYAADHKVKHLKIRVCIKHAPLVLPEALIASTSLISLNLHDAVSRSIELPKSVSLPHLKKLRLKKFEFRSTNFNGDIFSGCPRLETLVLSKCWIKPGDQLKILDVRCPNLVNLEIKRWRSPWRCFDEHTINVNAPKLSLFTLQGHIARVNFVETLCGLNEGNILLSYPSSCAMENGIERKTKSAEVCINLLRQIRIAKSLAISLKAAEIMSALPDLRLHTDFIFENLKYVKITVDSNHVEDTMPVRKVDMRPFMNFYECMSNGNPKEPESSPESSRLNKDVKPIMVPANVLQFLLESTPCANLVNVELLEASSE